jgi:hypothetical protein
MIERNRMSCFSIILKKNKCYQLDGISRNVMNTRKREEKKKEEKEERVGR